ncbi:hypothetical protein MJO28_004993 [Puccinia striiformis f. sp. tritici]|uniref:Uncharacterized protein n=3 Tax=Puccinia striiformis TaxID=27350 RepID=A0A0L0VBR3_9BASI|nr:hypothetical protein Pst134EA_009251 [Puccinia striiformis f. sp. tritici]KNE96751.1 hypothetical protein PSTG_09889 [Puccinia striiformis f. sp. tritici PST-78]POW11798.1 hypothetical protein PSTT_04990 [Puccinia striiformis]KAH9457926.1 hypothetical protein Pst134EB_010230 [Puccinia striiformis f. sp. tritici]KAH9468720.1 hypothetical protein Pst134EA_009251 [Puccinia striiformis f. sp. tritici]KAI7954593.1 hypothetical protein MJO28_004993 [Puccinia striiformis f. sp. tritici]
MDAFCSNTLSQTQCNGLTRIEFSSIVSVGIVQGFSGLILAGYLTFICQRQASSSAWILALTGILYLITTSLEAASRFVPGSLTQFLSMEKATAGLGNVTLILYFSFHVASVIVLTKRYDPKVAPIVAAILTSLAAVALAFNILALLAISYEELPEGIRAGAPDIKNFLDPSIKAIAAMLSFMGLTAITHVSIYYLLRRRKFQHQKQKEARRRKAMSSFSNSTLEDENSIMDSKEPLRRYFDTLIPSTLLAIIKTSLTLSSENTIIARRVIGLVEYISYALVVASCLRPPQAAKVERDNFFGRITSNPSFACSAGSEEVLVPPQMPRSNSILRRAHMASIVVGSNNSTSVFPSRVQQKPRDRKPPPSQTQSKMRMSYAAQSAISSLAPEDSASTAAFLPRPPPPPPHLRTRTTHGPNGSELAPLREDLVEKFNGFQIL